MPKPLTIEELEAAVRGGCHTPGCEHDHSTLFLHGRCHPKANVQASYTAGAGLLCVECAECGKLIAEIKVADERGLEKGHAEDCRCWQCKT